jgi:glycosyltransferase involved in cell wall biosynthesis
MYIGIVIRENHEVWGGDLKVVYDLKVGLEALGCRVDVCPSTLHLLDADYILLTNSTRDLRPHFAILQLYRIPFAILCFHEDCIQYALPSFGFANYLEKCLEGYVDNGVAYSLDRLLETPQIIHYFGHLPMRSPYYNDGVLKAARVCIVNSVTEQKTLLRDCPAARSAVIPLSPALSTFGKSHPGMLAKYAPLLQGEYILQVGRFETRKNQLASILATRHFDAPLVFIATKTVQTWYEKLCLNAIRAYRPHPTLVISETLDDAQIGSLRIMKMPEGKKMSAGMMESAYSQAGLYLHPAFCEVPGLTFFEAARAGAPVIASEWCTIKDTGLPGIEYPLPYDVCAIEQQVQKLFGRREERLTEHAALLRTPLDYAKDVLSCIRERT